MHLKIKECRLNFDTTSNFKSWLAGLLDGEGNFYIGKNQCMIRIVLEEKDKFVLDLIQKTIGGRLGYRKRQKSWKPHWKPQWMWIVSSKLECFKFTEWILPDLVLKKRIANKFYLELSKTIPEEVLI